MGCEKMIYIFSQPLRHSGEDRPLCSKGAAGAAESTTLLHSLRRRPQPLFPVRNTASRRYLYSQTFTSLALKAMSLVVSIVSKRMR